MMAEQAPRNLYRKIAAIMAEMEPVPKTGRNDFHKYNFIKAEVLFASLQRKLGEAGIVIIPRIEKVEQSPDGGKVLLATMSFRVVNADDPADSFDLPWAAQGSAGDDKAVAKCATSGMKYALMRLFFISDEEDPDAEGGSEPSQHARGTGQRQQAGGQAQTGQKPKDTTTHTEKAATPMTAADWLDATVKAKAKLSGKQPPYPAVMADWLRVHIGRGQELAPGILHTEPALMADEALAVNLDTLEQAIVRQRTTGTKQEAMA